MFVLGFCHTTRLHLGLQACRATPKAVYPFITAAVSRKRNGELLAA